MPFVPVPFVARFRMLFDNYGEPAQMTAHVERSSTTDWSVQTLTDRIDDFYDWWYATLQPMTNADVALVGISATCLTDTFAPKVDWYAPTPQYGAEDATPLPQNATVCISSHTGGRGRSYNGRTYFVGLSANRQQNGYVRDDTRLALETAFATLMTIINQLSYHLVVVSYQQNGVKLTTGLFYRITGYTVDNKMDSMRTRLPGR